MSDADELVERIAIVLAAAGVVADMRLCCALSGGVDSVVLFEVLCRLQPRFGYRLSAAHVHHGLSPHAGVWAEACVARCARAGVPLQVFHVEVDRLHRDGVEAAARAARHAALDTVACDWLAFGHHQDDQAETLLFRLLRGTGVRGAAAMRPATAAASARPGHLRPLLALRRAQIEDWARRVGLDWIEDESNTALHFTRNAIRHRLLPVAQALFPAAVPALARAAAHFAEADDLLGELAAADAAACGGAVLDRRRLLALSPARQANLVRWVLQRRAALPPSRATLDEVLRQLRACPIDHPLRLAVGEWACCAYRDDVWLERAVRAVPVAQHWRGEATLPWGDAQVCFEEATGAGLSRVALDGASEVMLGLRTPGMRFRVDVARPRRALRKLCQEGGIPVWLRDRLPVLWVDGEPAWVGGIGASAAFVCPPDAAGVRPRWVHGAGAGGD